MCCGEEMHGRHAERVVHGAPREAVAHSMCGCGCGCGERKFLGRKEKVEKLEKYRESLKSELERVEEELKSAQERTVAT
jgi:hypothetical protein